jgi:hypothetical protein
MKKVSVLQSLNKQNVVEERHHCYSTTSGDSAASAYRCFNSSSFSLVVGRMSDDDEEVLV